MIIGWIKKKKKLFFITRDANYCRDNGAQNLKTGQSRKIRNIWSPYATPTRKRD